MVQGEEAVRVMVPDAGQYCTTLLDSVCVTDGFYAPTRQQASHPRHRVPVPAYALAMQCPVLTWCASVPGRLVKIEIPSLKRVGELKLGPHQDKREMHKHAQRGEGGRGVAGGRAGRSGGERQTHRPADTQTHRRTDAQTHRHTDTQTQQTHRHTDTQAQAGILPPSPHMCTANAIARTRLCVTELGGDNVFQQPISGTLKFQSADTNAVKTRYCAVRGTKTSGSLVLVRLQVLNPATSLRECYEMPGTDVAYGGARHAHESAPGYDDGQ
eukprot:2158223-Rhodomonas_salina.3